MPHKQECFIFSKNWVTHPAFPAGELAWIDRFPGLKAAVRIARDDRDVKNAVLQNGEIQLPNAQSGENVVSLELPYYTCKLLHKDQVVLPLDTYAPNVFPAWLDKKRPSHFYSALVLFHDTGMITFDKDFIGYEDFTLYAAQAIRSQSATQDMRWGIKALASKLPRPIAVSREICFHLGHDDMSLPLFICISPTNVCNLCCTICGSQMHIDKNKIPREFMKREIFEKLAETLFPFCNFVELNSLGEPTLHKHFGYFVELINKYDCELLLQTNGTNLTDEVLQSMKSVRGRLSLSIDATGQIFEQQRVNASWKKVEANVRKLMAMRDKTKLAVTLAPTLTRKSAADAVPLCVWAGELGIDAVEFHYYDPICDGIEQCLTDEEKAVLESALRTYMRNAMPTCFILLQHKILRPLPGNRMAHFFKKGKKYLLRMPGRIAQRMKVFSNIRHTPGSPRKFPSDARRYDPIPKPSPQQHGAHPRYACAAPLNNAFINMAGDISVCCRTLLSVFGSALTDETFFACWFGEQMRTVRKSFLREKPTADSMPECKGCVAMHRHYD
ncbi:MAG: radical SAM protein [Deltaproteobacteria bacterium]|jgi:sulfatase maturation enzyme AslB (radical SAM superfamily)|nr:radical SAM protein [Deltaproteobacteria bacterium]